MKKNHNNDKIMYYSFIRFLFNEILTLNYYVIHLCVILNTYIL